MKEKEKQSYEISYTQKTERKKNQCLFKNSVNDPFCSTIKSLKDCAFCCGQCQSFDKYIYISRWKPMVHTLFRFCIHKFWVCLFVIFVCVCVYEAFVRQCHWYSSLSHICNTLFCFVCVWRKVRQQECVLCIYLSFDFCFRVIIFHPFLFVLCRSISFIQILSVSPANVFGSDERANVSNEF